MMMDRLQDLLLARPFGSKSLLQKSVPSTFTSSRSLTDPL